jgi:hypothetical protein
MKPILPHLAPLCISFALALVACHAENDDVSPESRSAEITEGRAVSIELSDGIEHEQVQAIAGHVENGFGADVAAAKVKVMQDHEGGATMVVELWGSGLPEESALEAGLAQEFPALANAAITVEALDAADGPAQVEAHSDAEDPEVAKQEIIDELRAQGVEGDIEVDVEDGPDGRRVEVQVEDRKSE